MRDLFATIAPRYDLINDLQSLGLHRWWKRRLVQWAGVRPGERALDLCCGTGDVALAMARAEGFVIGLDFSERMLAVAQNRLRRSTREPRADRNGGEWKEGLGSVAGPCGTRQTQRDIAPAEGPAMPGLPNPPNWPTGASVVFLRGDALHLPFQDGQFDVVTISYGLRNLADFEAGMREMARVLRPGGRLLILDFGKPDHARWRQAYFGYLRWMVPLFGRVFCGDSELYAYILESLRHYPAQHGVAALMTRMGFEKIRIASFLGGVMAINYGEKASPGTIR